MNPELHNSNESEPEEGELIELSSLELEKIATEVKAISIQDNLDESRAFAKVARTMRLYHNRTDGDVEKIRDTVNDILNRRAVSKGIARGARNKSLGWLTEWQNKHDK